MAAPNVVPFKRPSHGATKGAAPEITISPADRPAPAFARTDRRAAAIAIFLGSLMIHAALYAAVNREPEPMASIGLEVVSIDIVLGDNREAGTPAPLSEAQQTLAERSPQTDAIPSEELRPVEETEMKTAELSVASPETPEPETRPPVAPPEVTAALGELPTPGEEAKREDAAPPPIMPKPAAVHPSSRKTDTKAQHREPRVARADPAAPMTGSNGISPGGSSANSNYHGLVAAHLARYKRFPADARNRGDEGRPVVTFVLDGGGRVARVVLARASGVASFDQEAQAMVHRASPFPAPPDGRSVSFTVPVSFRIQ